MYPFLAKIADEVVPFAPRKWTLASVDDVLDLVAFM